MIRGLWTHAGVLYKVDDDKLYSVDSANLLTYCGTLFSRGGPVDFDSTVTQLCVNDGTFLYVYNPVAASFGVATGYPGGDRISFLNERINALKRGTQQFNWSGLADATTWDVLDFASAESSPDLLVSQLAFNDELILIGEYSTEIWDPNTSGIDEANTVYTKSTAAIDYGCIAPFSAQKTPNTAFWLSRDQYGQAMVVGLRGHQAARISTRAEEEKFEGKNLQNARAFTYTQGGQSFYCLNVPGLDTTLVWDETFSQWHERAEWAGSYAQWAPTCHAFAYGKHYLGCGANLCVLDGTLNTNNGATKLRRRIAPVISKPTMARVTYAYIELLCEKGTGAKLQLRWSDDNGNTWSNWHYTTVGAVGKFKSRARFNRLGSGFNRVFDLQMTDNAPFNPVMVDVGMQ